MAEDAPDEDRPGECPGCGGPVSDDQVICVSCGLNLRTGERIETRSGDPDAPPPDAGDPARPRPARAAGGLARSQERVRKVCIAVLLAALAAFACWMWLPRSYGPVAGWELAGVDLKRAVGPVRPSEPGAQYLDRDPGRDEKVIFLPVEPGGPVMRALGFRKIEDLESHLSGRAENMGMRPARSWLELAGGESAEAVAWLGRWEADAVGSRKTRSVLFPRILRTIVDDPDLIYRSVRDNRRVKEVSFLFERNFTLGGKADPQSPLDGTGFVYVVPAAARPVSVAFAPRWSKTGDPVVLEVKLAKAPRTAPPAAAPEAPKAPARRRGPPDSPPPPGPPPDPTGGAEPFGGR